MSGFDGAVSETQRYVGVRQERTTMFQKVTTVALIGTALVLAACNTVRGAARDVNSVANCTENAINGTKSC
jgi:predicted small secreted protein